jgi:hypothetical protein
MEHLLRQQATEAIQGAAERLGVDPIRLARFLADGKLADVLLQLRATGMPDRDVIRMAESYLSFLDHEIALRQDLRKDQEPRQET